APGTRGCLGRGRSRHSLPGMGPAETALRLCAWGTSIVSGGVMGGEALPVLDAASSQHDEHQVNRRPQRKVCACVSLVSCHVTRRSMPWLAAISRQYKGWCPSIACIKEQRSDVVAHWSR